MLFAVANKQVIALGLMEFSSERCFNDIMSRSYGRGGCVAIHTQTQVNYKRTVPEHIKTNSKPSEQRDFDAL
ncbi:hypothetical protein CY34DRAFT_799624 [Suillus luteus UH-Slu-Lm8-n1]|uniref:Uncharacterized protein n=1 Tax=Suillus luteus UH-Slu-Lm8-n1 TaxID=930992 RepID=A0A0D0BWE7_9AGAM|nr:hypothetical protein CY34DRAFT_799624 [Suillus luteus UH-Slu-Lm8-n1]